MVVITARYQYGGVNVEELFVKKIKIILKNTVPATVLVTSRPTVFASVGEIRYVVIIAARYQYGGVNVEECFVKQIEIIVTNTAPATVTAV